MNYFILSDIYSNDQLQGAEYGDDEEQGHDEFEPCF